jgi:hypothetical protein
MKTAVGILALAVWWVLFVGPGDVSAQGAARVAARVAPRVASAREPAAAPLIPELRPNAPLGALRATAI